MQSKNVNNELKPTQNELRLEDAAPSIVLAAERYNKSEPVNIGAGFEISMRGAG